MTDTTSTSNIQTLPQLSSEQAQAALQFLQRTQLQGAEMQAYVSVFNVLSAIVQSANEDGASAAT